MDLRMGILKKVLTLVVGVFNPRQSEDRLKKVSEETEELQKQTEKYLKDATMNGEIFWFLEQKRKRNHIDMGGV